MRQKTACIVHEKLFQYARHSFVTSFHIDLLKLFPMLFFCYGKSSDVCVFDVTVVSVVQPMHIKVFDSLFSVPKKSK